VKVKVHPLSLEQQTVYAVASVSPELVFDDRQNLYVMVRLRGPVDVQYLQAAFDDLVARHSALRTRPALREDGSFEQEELDEASAPVTVDEAAAGLPLDELIARLADTPISHQHPPFARVSLTRLDGGDHLLYLGIQHVACDVTGLYLALSDLARAYTAHVEGGRLEPLPTGYGDYARWQAAHFADRLERDAGAWGEYLRGLEPYEVKADLPFQPGLPGMAGRSLKVPVLDATGAELLPRFATRHRATAFVTLLLAFQLALGSRTRSGERFSATYFDQRDLPAAKEMVGFFLRPTFVRSRLPPDRPASEVLVEMTKRALEAHRLAHVPLLHVVSAYPDALGALMGQSPPWYFVLHYMPQPEPADLRFGEARGAVVHSGVNSRQEPGLALGLRRDVEGRLNARISYDPTQWREDTVRALGADFARALRALLEDPSRRVSELAAAPGSW
jgi:condensation domain-containing protein